jgi:histidinol dehydrogenase
MRVRRFEWEGAIETAKAVRGWARGSLEKVDPETLREIQQRVVDDGNVAVLELTERFDGADPERRPDSPRVDPAEAESALAGLKAPEREALQIAVANVRAVAEAQVDPEAEPLSVTLPQGQSVTLRERSVQAAGVYAPGGRAAYPSSVLMCAIPARVAGVDRVALASPPGPDWRLDPLVLAAAALCEIDEIYAMGGAQAIFALAHGTETIKGVDVIAGPGNPWVQEAKRRVHGFVGIDSYAGPSELMLVAGHDTDPRWAATDLCAQAEHSAESPLLAAAVEQAALDAIVEQTEALAAERPSVADAQLAIVQVPDLLDAIALANVFAPEHLELLEEDAALMADRVTTAGCVFVGRYGATAFGDYAAGSNHVLPTAGSGRFSGPLGPDVFRRKTSTVEIPAGAAAKLAPHVDAIARAEGFPVHGESAMIRAEDG